MAWTTMPGVVSPVRKPIAILLAGNGGKKWSGSPPTLNPCSRSSVVFVYQSEKPVKIQRTATLAVSDIIAEARTVYNSFFPMSFDFDAVQKLINSPPGQLAAGAFWPDLFGSLIEKVEASADGCAEEGYCPVVASEIWGPGSCSKPPDISILAFNGSTASST